VELEIALLDDKVPQDDVAKDQEHTGVVNDSKPSISAENTTFALVSTLWWSCKNRLRERTLEAKMLRVIESVHRIFATRTVL
jgi:hypothetical protein